MPHTRPDEEFQRRQSIRRKTPSEKQRESSKIPAFRGHRLIPNHVFDEITDTDESASESASDVAEQSQSNLVESEED